MNALVVDMGGTHMKVLASVQTQPRRFDSGPVMGSRGHGGQNPGDHPRLDL